MNYSWFCFDYLANESGTHPLVIISFRKEIMFWVCYIPTLWHDVIKYPVFFYNRKNFWYFAFQDRRPAKNYLDCICCNFKIYYDYSWVMLTEQDGTMINWIILIIAIIISFTHAINSIVTRNIFGTYWLQVKCNSTLLMLKSHRHRRLVFV